MDKVYITGHRNPDTDSIVSAMAYAALKNALGQRQYCAARRYHQPGLADDAGGPDLRTACGQ